MSAALTRRLTSSALREPELHEDRVDVLLDRALGEEQLLGDRLVALALRDLGEDLELARGQLAERRRARAHARGDQRLDHLRVDDRAAARRPRRRRRDQLLAIAQSRSLSRYARRVGPALEQREAVRGVGVLADHDDADRGVGLAQPVGERDPLVLARRRHPDVGHDDVGELARRPPRAARRRPRRSRRARAAVVSPSRCAERLADEVESSATTIRSGRSGSVVTAVPARSCAHRRKRGRGGRRPALAAAPSMR